MSRTITRARTERRTILNNAHEQSHLFYMNLQGDGEVQIEQSCFTHLKRTSFARIGGVEQEQSALRVRALLASTLGVIALNKIELLLASMLTDLKTFTMPIDGSLMEVGPMPSRCEGLKPYNAIGCRFTAYL
jgi:hypothetical protein